MKLSLVKITIILTIVAVAITFATAQSDWSQFQKDEVSSGQTAGSAPITAPDNWSQHTANGSSLLEGNYGIDTTPIFKYQVDNSPGISDPSEEFNATEYANIRFDDNVYASNQSTANGNYAAHRFNFSIDDNEKDFITKINVTWKGIGKHDTVTDGAKLYIYNFTSDTYEHLQTSANVETEVTLTGEKTASSNYISSINNVTVLVNQTSTQTTGPPPQNPKYYSHIETDYVKLVVTP